MPGRVLVIDPIVTNRVVLKAQLSAKYFTVDAAPDISGCDRLFAKTPPDVVVLNYDVEDAAGFSTCKRMKNNPRTSHIPILLLCRNIEDTFWETAYQLGVDELLPALPDAELLCQRLAQLIRRKEAFDAQHLRQNAYQAMGFAEDTVTFPPNFPSAITINCEHAVRFARQRAGTVLENLLKSSFPVVGLVTGDTPNCPVLLLDETQFGRETALQKLCRLKQAVPAGGRRSRILYLSEDASAGSLKRALELGADDFAPSDCPPAELANRIRRLAWVHEFEDTAERKVSDRLRLALRDPMTGLHNRRYALQHLDNILAGIGRDNRSVTVMMLDLDKFKSVNDSHGHEAGDTVICAVAKALQSSLRSVDLVARFGGEEFLVVLTDTSDRQALAIAERVRMEIKQLKVEVENSTGPLKISISIGIAASPCDQISSAALIDQADKALYKSKGLGRNRVTFSRLAA